MTGTAYTLGRSNSFGTTPWLGMQVERVTLRRCPDDGVVQLHAALAPRRDGLLGDGIFHTSKPRKNARVATIVVRSAPTRTSIHVMVLMARLV